MRMSWPGDRVEILCLAEEGPGSEGHGGG